MQATITVGELALGLLFILVVGLGVYATVILRRINAITRQLHMVVAANEARLGEVLTHLATVMENSAEISSQLRAGVSQTGQTLKLIGREAADTLLSINKTADYVSTYAVIIHEVIKSVINLFSGPDRK